MISRQRKYLTLILSLLYLSATLFLELGHTDIIEGSFGTFHRILSHDCSGREMHKPLGIDDQCPVCVRNSQTTACVGHDHFTTKPAFEIIRTCIVLTFTPRPERTTSFVRGPPLSLA